MEKIIKLAKSRGFIYPDSEIYGGWANAWDFGPLGVELKNNIKQAWWKRFVHSRLDIVGLETAVIMNPKVWEASGHVDEFSDPLAECKKCHHRSRADEMGKDQTCMVCGEKGGLTQPAQFNLLFKTFVGPKENEAAVAYLRPETAQGMFVDWPAVLTSTRKRLPFGMAQIGKAFRNEITPGNYVFRTREFEQMEIEYFIEPKNWETEFDRWLHEIRGWIEYCGISRQSVQEVEIAEEERAFYSRRTVDFELEWPFGQKELYGLAYRGDWDLKVHAKRSGRDMTYIDPKTGRKFTPHVIEPSFGVERTVLAMLLSAYREEEVNGEKRVVLGWPAWAAPYQAAVLPLSNKPQLVDKARALAEELAGVCRCDFDTTQSIGKRYRRQDEIGTPLCVTVDFQTLEDQAVTIRERDTMKQERLGMTAVAQRVLDKLKSGRGET